MSRPELVPDLTIELLVERLGGASIEPDHFKGDDRSPSPPLFCARVHSLPPRKFPGFEIKLSFRANSLKSGWRNWTVPSASTGYGVRRRKPRRSFRPTK